MKKSLKSTLLTLFCIGFVTLGVSACKSTKKEKVPYDENFIDYVHDGSVQLGLDYVGKDFYKDGIGQFTLKTAIDGDTAHFTPLVDSMHMGTMKARFYGIDTPESTGKVQEYGKPASHFTHDKLEEANANGTIVVSSAQNTYGPPEPDSTGSRYVSLVWINLTKKNAPLDELYLLNLWIVQDGLSWVKNVQDMPQYQDTFYAAEAQAKDYKMNLHSQLPDPEFNYGDYEDASLLDIKNEVQESLQDPDHTNAFDGAKIRIQGTVVGFMNHILYLQDFVYYDPDDLSKGGEWCGINIFVGMGDISSKYTKLNTFIQVCGLAQYTENYGFQVTDTQGRFPVGSATSENDAKVIYTAEQNAETEHNMQVQEFTLTELNNIAKATDPYDLRTLNCRTTVVTEADRTVAQKLKVSRSWASDSGDITLYFENADFNCYVPFNYKGDPDKPNKAWNAEDFVGKSFTLVGVYVLHKNSNGDIKFQIVPNGTPDLVWIQD